MATKPVLLGLTLALLALVAVAEVVLQAQQTSAAASTEDWTALAKHVRSQWQNGDVVQADQDWADPLIRMHLGDQISKSDAARSSLDGFSRVWNVAVGATPTAPSANASLLGQVSRFGPLELSVWSLPAIQRFDLVEKLGGAAIEVQADQTSCTRQTASPTGGGLGRGPTKPAIHWQCPGERKWIGATTIEDLSYQPRRCIWHPARQSKPIRITFENVPRSDKLVVHGGHYLRDERKEDGPPVQLNVYVDGQLEGRMTHRDGDGWKRFEMALPKTKSTSVAIEAVATGKDQNFCWAASALAAKPSRAKSPQ